MTTTTLVKIAPAPCQKMCIRDRQGMNTATTLAGCTDPLLLVFVGLLTGTGGGVLRDILAGDMPYILRKHIYASASIAGGILYLLLQQVWQGAGAILTLSLIHIGQAPAQ